MADILNISQSKYCRFENNCSVLEWNKIPLLTNILELKITDVIPTNNEKKSIYIENQNNTNTEAISKITELYEALIEEKNETIRLLKSQIK